VAKKSVGKKGKGTEEEIEGQEETEDGSEDEMEE
jgi:ribosome biogenesis protein SSF1/2